MSNQFCVFKKISLFLTLSLLTLTVSAIQSGASVVAYSGNAATLTTLEISGCGRFFLENGPKWQVRLQNYPLAFFTAKAHDHRLSLRVRPIPQGRHKCPSVSIQVPAIQQLVVKGSSTVLGTHFKNKFPLTIKSSGATKINLTGLLNVSRITQRGHNQLVLRWIDSPNLEISSTGSNHVELSGVAGHLYARLKGRSVLNARYLRTQYSEVQTKNHATAHVTPLIALRAFASGYSTIYYYHAPKTISRQAVESGNILQAGWQP